MGDGVGTRASAAALRLGPLVGVDVSERRPGESMRCSTTRWGHSCRNMSSFVRSACARTALGREGSDAALAIGRDARRRGSAGSRAAMDAIARLLVSGAEGRSWWPLCLANDFSAVLHRWSFLVPGPGPRPHERAGFEGGTDAYRCPYPIPVSARGSGRRRDGLSAFRGRRGKGPRRPRFAKRLGLPRPTVEERCSPQRTRSRWIIRRGRSRSTTALARETGRM